MRYITIREFCDFHGCDVQIIESFVDQGVVQPHPGNDENEIKLLETDIEPLEIALRLHQDLGINPAGVDTILEMRRRMEEMHRELMKLQVRLRRYEAGVSL